MFGNSLKTIAFLAAIVSLATRAAEPLCRMNAQIHYPLILNYHDTVPRPEDKIVEQDLTLDEVKEHIRILRDQGYRFVSLYDFMAALRKGESLPEKSVIMTFDDGYEHNFEAFQYFKNAAIKASFFVIPIWVGKSIPEKNYLSWEQITEMSRSPLIEIASHTYSHPDLKTLSEDKLVQEYRDSQNELAQRLKLPKAQLSFLAYPYGHYDRLSATVAGRFYAMAFTTSSDPLATQDLDFGLDPCLQIPRLMLERAHGNPEKFLARVRNFETQLRKYEQTPRPEAREPSSTKAAPKLWREFHRRW